MIKQSIALDDPTLAGNWYPFPPPDEGIYDLRQLQLVEQRPVGCYYYGARRVYPGTNGRLMMAGRRVTRMPARDGWQFRFMQELHNCVPVNYRPFAVIYGPTPTPGLMQIIRKEDVSQQLPLARSRAEALYVVRQIPDRWPIFRQIHVEYTPEVLSS